MTIEFDVWSVLEGVFDNLEKALVLTIVDDWS